MRAVVSIASRLKQAQRPLQQDLAILYRTLIHGLEPLPIVRELIPEEVLYEEAELYVHAGTVPKSIEETIRADGGRSDAWRIVLELLNNWLIACPARLYFTYTDDRLADGQRRPYRVDFAMSFIAGDQRGCFPALVFQLLSEIRGGPADFMLRCTHCEDSFTPRTNEKFCPACRAERWPQRYASKHYYAEKRDKILQKRKRKRQAAKK
jgi:hypothetical protein